MTCVVVTRGGWGDIWKFSTQHEADLHPICQYGDAVLCGPEDVLEAWGELWLPEMIQQLIKDNSFSKRSAEDIAGAATRQIRSTRLAAIAEEVWRELQRMAVSPPQEPSEILRLITLDRKMYTSSHPRSRSTRTEERENMTTAETTTTAPEKPKTFAGHPLTATLHFNADKEGKLYGPDNNPKRAGSASAELFTKYVDGMTLAEAKEAGISSVAVKWDFDHGFITISA